MYWKDIVTFANMEKKDKGETRLPVAESRGSAEEVSTDLSDVTEMERQIIRQLPPGYYWDAEDWSIVRNSRDLPECVDLITDLGQRISVPTSRVVLGLPD